jgi:hypothetical protein
MAQSDQEFRVEEVGGEEEGSYEGGHAQNVQKHQADYYEQTARIPVDLVLDSDSHIHRKEQRKHCYEKDLKNFRNRVEAWVILTLKADLHH